MLLPVQEKRLHQLKESIISYEKNNDYLKVAVFEEFVFKINKFVAENKIEIEDFDFEDPFHYSSTYKTINDEGYMALLYHIELIEVSIKSMPSEKERGNILNQKEKEKIFIVHGRDEFAKLEAESLVHRIGLEPIILSLMANRGRTIMEKFIEHSDVKYALVLLTPDDVGALNDSSVTLGPRARQNVIFELGYFYGKLGRENVCCTMKSTVDVPSDINGVVYLPYNNSLTEIQLDLYREFKAAGLDFNVF